MTMETDRVEDMLIVFQRFSSWELSRAQNQVTLPEGLPLVPMVPSCQLEEGAPLGRRGGLQAGFQPLLV